MRKIAKENIKELPNGTTVLIIKADHKVSLGHQAHITGTGVHGDRRTKRQRTRSANRRKAILEHV